MTHRIGRRRLLGAAGAGVALGAMPLRLVAQDATNLNFVVWNYSLDTIQDNIGKFEAEHPGVKVALTDYTWPDYFDTMMLRFRGNTPTHVMYCGEDWLPGWALAGWLAPIEDHFPAIAAYKDKVTKYALGDMSYKGKLYGLPYYADLITFQYNHKILEDNKIAVPTSWEEVLDASLKLKKAGMEKPFVYEYNQTLPNFYQAFVSQVYGRGGQLFDADLTPLFNDPGSEAFKHLQWLQDAVKKHDIVAFENHESRIIPAMNTGKHAFSVLFNYVLAAMNEKATQPLAGQFSMALMPGKAQACLGFCKFYAMTSQAAADDKLRDASWQFIEFMGGGDFQVAKRWAEEKGLGFAQLPLFDDPGVQKAWSSWIDVETFKKQATLAISGTQTEWLGMWSGYFRPLMAKAMVGESSVAETMDAGAKRWLELRKLVRGT
jgi:multiple sugar transport system substrate-binding protein